ncbi:TetR/AcrR family transcriptional regulator [Nocardiopsis deserti]|uniref:TetR/AcrR family transcriptional regulator n=1 Tax=Nocardiopsis deserti TaxID=2605988 RepID=UPI00123A5BA0|nr:TetR/AcrR family transcriptional regulator [Nocardiopsis deserti]
MPARTPRTAPGGDAPSLRADALHNRHRIVEAARAAFSERGIDVPMSAIARRAGVGIATLYRRFPTRESLVTEVFADQLSDCASHVDDALADPDPWRGFCTAVERVCEMQAADRGFTGAFLTAFPGAVPFEEKRERAERGLTELIRRAKAAGRLRPDFALEDLTLLILANCGAASGPPEAAAASSRRLVAYLLQSFENTGEPRPLPAVPRIGLDQIPDLATG